MSNYTKTTNFASKDNLSPGNPLKIVKGSEIDTEYNNIATAIATKTDNASAAITGGTIVGITDLAVADGGTGASTAAGALNNLLPSQTSAANKYLQSDGTNASWDAVSLSTADITGTLPVANGGTGVTSSTGTGAVVLSNSPTLVTPALGTPSALVGTNITGTASGLTAGSVTTNANLTGAVTSVGNATSLGSFSSANLLGALTDETGTGSAVFATSPTLVTPILGTPTSATLTNATGLPISTGVSGLGTGVATALAVNVGSTGAAVVNGGVLGTPSSGTATNLTGLPLTTGVTGQLPVANGGTGTATPSIVAGSNVTVTGTWPNQTIAAAGSSAGGSDTQVQYNNAGAFGGISGATTNGTALTLTGAILNGTIGATTPSTGAFTSITASTTLGVTGVSTFSAGTAALPALTTTGDTNTGIFFPAADTLATSIGGTERARFTSAGYFKATDNGSYQGATDTWHEFNQSANGSSFIIKNTNASLTGTVFNLQASRDTTNGSYNFIVGSCPGVAVRFTVADSGNVANANNSYGALSDFKIKQDIVDAGSQWSDIKGLRVRKFRLKNNPTGPLQIGVIAQEIEVVSAGLIDERPDYEDVEVPVLDEQGNPVLNEDGSPQTKIEPQATGETTKAVKYSVLYMKAVKALQEAMTRIEQLEARLDAANL